MVARTRRDTRVATSHTLRYNHHASRRARDPQGAAAGERPWTEMSYAELGKSSAPPAAAVVLQAQPAAVLAQAVPATTLPV
eukprot:COSAG02_NODE_1068_length_14812_cov_15.091342_9_plen_81_part_00